MKNQKTMGNKGFSLVELIVVIAIMAVLVGVLAPQFIKYVESSRQSTDIQNIQQLKTAIEVELAENESGATASIKVAGTTVTVDGVTVSTTSIPTMKSSGWATTIQYDYNSSTGKWTKNASSASTVNGKAPGKDLATVFN